MFIDMTNERTAKSVRLTTWLHGIEVYERTGVKVSFNFTLRNFNSQWGTQFSRWADVKAWIAHEMNDAG